MKIGTKVGWVTSKGVSGTGWIIGASTDTFTEGHVLVAVDAEPGEEHRVIYCAETWLTKLSVEAS